MNRCTSRPDCPCAFCILSRNQPSARDEERQLAEAFIEDFCRRRDREMDPRLRGLESLERTPASW
jgi:hypothetical protein